MGFPIQTPVQAVPGIFIPASGDTVSVTTHDLFLIPSGEPARLESVYLQAVAAVAFIDITLELLLIDLSGVVLYRNAIPTSIGGSPNIDTIQITWARGSYGSNQLSAPLPLDSATGSGLLVYTLPLPELVMQAQSTVALIVDQTSDGGLPAVTVSDIAITYTPGEGGNNTIMQAYPQPYLVPATG